MPSFPTPEHVRATVELAVGRARVVAGDRTDTVVTVQPTDPGRRLDVEAAEQTRVEHGERRVVVTAPKARGMARLVSTRYGSVDVTVELPTGSDLEVRAGVADVRAEGRLGDVDVRLGMGDVELGRTARLHVKTFGEVAVGGAEGHATVTGAGDLRLGEVDGSAAVKNVNGRIWVGDVTGSLRAKSANGDIVIDRAQRDVVVKTANGSVRVGEVVRDSIVLGTAAGDVEVGVRAGTAAWLDVGTKTGSVHNSLEDAGGPEAAQETARIEARTAYGDIVVRRA